MSADRWSECPKCRNQTEIAIREIRQKAAKLYGTAEEQVYKELLSKADEMEVQLENMDCMLREDYELGTSEAGDKFEVRYSASCQAGECDYEYSYTRTEKTGFSPL
jgi:hypothetical protein